MCRLSTNQRTYISNPFAAPHLLRIFARATLKKAGERVRLRAREGEWTSQGQGIDFWLGETSADGASMVSLALLRARLTLLVLLQKSVDWRSLLSSKVERPFMAGTAVGRFALTYSFGPELHLVRNLSYFCKNMALWLLNKNKFLYK